MNRSAPHPTTFPPDGELFALMEPTGFRAREKRAQQLCDRITLCLKRRVPECRAWAWPASLATAVEVRVSLENAAGEEELWVRRLDPDYYQYHEAVEDLARAVRVWAVGGVEQSEGL